MIYVLSPLFRTGGVELLHQLAHELSRYTGVQMFYTSHGDPIDEYAYCQTEYVYELPDNDDFVIVPEIYARANIGQHRRVIFWESVDNYLARSDDTNFDPSIIHLAQSEYAWDFLINVVKAKNVMRVSDYINEEFLEPYDEKQPRKPIVLYNPAKGMQYTQKVIDAMPDVQFLPLSGLSRTVLRNIMRGSMLYIDLGDHPGKDRMPREAAASGCCVLTSREGSAMYWEDVPIPNHHKIERTDVDKITKRIRAILGHYELWICDFRYYQAQIKVEKQIFQYAVKCLAAVLLMDTDLMMEVINEIQHYHSST